MSIEGIMNIEELIKQMPNFLGLLVCIWFMRDMSRALQQQNARLIDVIIRRENCDDDITPAPKRDG